MTISEFLAEQKRLTEDGRTVFTSDVLRVIAAVEAVMMLHTDGGSSQGYFKEGDRWEYTSREHCCVTCGTHGEYGVEWPCPTIRAIEAALIGGEGE